MKKRKIELCKYARELGDCLRKCDVNELRAFMEQRRGMFPVIPNDKILEVSLHKMIVNRTDMPEELQSQSTKWLQERGYSIKII